MKKEIPSYIHTLDQALSEISREIRIIYLESDYPDILTKVLDVDEGSSKLREWLNMNANTEPTFQGAVAKGLSRSLLKVYRKIDNTSGILEGNEYYSQMAEKSGAYAPFILKSSGEKKDTMEFYYKINDMDTYRFVFTPCEEDDCNKCSKKNPGPTHVYKMNNKMSCFDSSLTRFQMNVSLSKPRSLVLFFYLTDADSIDSKSLGGMIQAFLDSQYTYPDAKLILTGSCRNIPYNFASRIQLIRLGAPSGKDIRLQLKKILAAEKMSFNDKEIDFFAETMHGLTYMQIDGIYASFGEGHIGRELKKPGVLENAVWEQKRLESEKDNILHFTKIDENPGIVGVGGFVNWLNECIPDLVDPEEAKKLGLHPPRGSILAGVPGTGKSQLAKQMAYQWSNYGEKKRIVSYVEFQIGNLFSKEFGESEARLKRFLARIEEQEPAVLLVDEVEKTFFKEHDNQSMHEVKSQQMAIFLGWLQEHKENIFTFMTSNDISILPPELIRSGRLSERFFVFLPNYEELMSILYSMLRNRKIFDINFSNDIKNKWSIINQYSQNNMKNGLKNSFRGSVIGNVLNDFAKKAETDGRTPFMTGADMGDAVENAIRYLRYRKKDNLGRWSEQQFAEALAAVIGDQQFKPYGQNNLEGAVQLYLSCDYREISSDSLLPRYQFDSQTGKFNMDEDGQYIQNTRPDNDYDKYMQKVFVREIEKAAAEKLNDKKYKELQMTIIQDQADSIPHQKKMRAYQEKQMDKEA